MIKHIVGGGNSSGQLGNNSTINSGVPVAVNTSGVLAGKTIKQISAGSSHTCAIASDDKAYCWGVIQVVSLVTIQPLIPVSLLTSTLPKKTPPFLLTP